MTDRVNMTDGREVLNIPASAVHALKSLGWKATDSEPKPAKRAAPKRPAPKPTLDGAVTNRSK